MTTPVQYKNSQDFDLLIENVSEVLAREGALPSKSFELEVQRSEKASSYDVNIVTVRFSEGGFRRFFMKDYGHSVRVKHDPEKRRDCEFGVYRDLLTLVSLGTARYLGSRWGSGQGEPERGEDATGGRRWLFLEYVPGTEVRNCRMPAWHAAVRWLGRMQGAFAQHGDALGRASFLERHDAAFFERTEMRATDAVRHFDPMLEPRFDRIAERYRSVHALMTEQPKTLVHGAYRPQNLLVRQDSDPPAICVTDWERAALGSTFFDFGCFAYGFESPELDHLWSSYEAGAKEYGMLVGTLDAARPFLECIYLHRIVNWLAHSVQHSYKPATVERLIALGERHSETQAA